MSTRAEFLGRIRQELAKTGGLFAASVTPRPADPTASLDNLRGKMTAQRARLLERFRAEFENVGGIFHQVNHRNEVAALIGRIARERRAVRIAAWSEQALGWDLAGALNADGFEAVSAPHEKLDDDGKQRIRQITAQAEIGITGAELAIAETGTLVLISGPGKPRSTSLLPPYHLAIFEKDALVESLEHAGLVLEWLHTDPDRNMGGAMINFISGPSRTADIELTLTRGVHGPKEVHAILVDPSGRVD